MEISAYKIIDIINKGKADCLVLLDCHITTRSADMWKREKGNTEIIAAGAPNRDPDGRDIEGRGGGFTDTLIYALLEFVEEIDEKYKGSTAKRSIPELMARHRELCSNPLRIWIRPKKAYGRKEVKDAHRFVIDPMQVRKTKKLEFFSVQIRGPGDGADDNPEGEEEGAEEEEGDEEDGEEEESEEELEEEHTEASGTVQHSDDDE